MHFFCHIFVFLNYKNNNNANKVTYITPKSLETKPRGASLNQIMLWSCKLPCHVDDGVFRRDVFGKRSRWQKETWPLRCHSLAVKHLAKRLY